MITVRKSRDNRYRVWELLHRPGFAPLVDGRPPTWWGKMPRALEDVMHQAWVPECHYTRPIALGDQLTVIEPNAPLLSAISTATLAHGHLEHTGYHNPAKDHVHPGYYLVDVHRWGVDGPGSPLGGSPLGAARVWVTERLYATLRDLSLGSSWTSGGMWRDLKAYDSWTCVETHRLADWALALRNLRADLMQAGDYEGLRELEHGIETTVRGWSYAGSQVGAFRPDWAHSIRTHVALNAWIRAYQVWLTGNGPVELGGPVGHGWHHNMTFQTRLLNNALSLPRSPIRLDESGRTLGTYTRTRRFYYGTDTADDQL